MKNLALALPVLVLALPAQAAEPTNMITMDGTCESLVVDGDDLSADCKDSVMQVIYDIGRVGLYAFAGEQIVTFSGTSDEVIDNEIHHQLDQVVLGVTGSDPRSVPARGTCIYENPYEGAPARFTCEARAKSGASYTLSFVTDGATPEDIMAED
ncbi:hypothetical protein [Devosia sediminis]|uniref:Uncharacterized protein n=1 Tax=Devosia sediminis TaxID=2798801 RepID=A0A934IUX9_9HYPH|nr:hypothetical protein [Devosia sediminis]MBJ3783536.1 hypothetical protein [Devosia sediminis]